MNNENILWLTVQKFDERLHNIENKIKFLIEEIDSAVNISIDAKYIKQCLENIVEDN